MYRCLIPYLAGVFSPTSTTRNGRRKIVFRTRPGLEPIPDSSRPTHARRQPSRQSRCQTTRTRPRSWSPSKLQKKLNAMNSTFNFTISENEIWRENRLATSSTKAGSFWRSAALFRPSVGCTSSVAPTTEDPTKRWPPLGWNPNGITSTKVRRAQVTKNGAVTFDPTKRAPLDLKV